MNIAVIGGGIAGLAVAWLLPGCCPAVARLLLGFRGASAL